MCVRVCGRAETVRARNQAKGSRGARSPRACSTRQPPLFLLPTHAVTCIVTTLTFIDRANLVRFDL